MHYTRNQHINFLDEELEKISEDYLKLLHTEAIALLKENIVYISQFIKIELEQHIDEDGQKKFSGSGQIILKFKNDKGLPRKQEYLVALLLDGEMSLPKNWNNISWGNLRRHQVKFSEIHCVWQGKSDENGFLLCGFQGLSLDMAEYLIEKKLQNCVVVLGPTEPPIEYYQNLIEIVRKDNHSEPIAKILDYDDDNCWNPQPISSKDNPAKKIAEHIKNSDELIVQGPPGTGKTHIMANIISELLDCNKSVLVTALTNRALIELASKESLHRHLHSGNIYKSNISTDELSICKGLMPIEGRNIFCSPGKLTLTTFFNSSGWAKHLDDGVPFDYVIMDEASQALFAMVATCKILGKKIIWIGDQMQLPPIVALPYETMIKKDYVNLAKGFQTLCNNLNFKSFMLTDTYRLQQQTAKLTSLFYNIPLNSVSSTDLISSNLPFLNTNGETLFIEKEMKLGKENEESCIYTINIVNQILTEHPNLSVAVLSKFKRTVKLLQNCFLSKYGSPKNVLIETIDRVQGMTCDICIYFIPNTLFSLSLNKELFNVATSRAKQHTLIISDKRIFNENMPIEVRKYLGNIKKIQI